jgi:hypothetical protein
MQRLVPNDMVVVKFAAPHLKRLDGNTIRIVCVWSHADFYVDNVWKPERGRMTIGRTAGNIILEVQVCDRMAVKQGWCVSCNILPIGGDEARQVEPRKGLRDPVTASIHLSTGPRDPLDLDEIELRHVATDGPWVQLMVILASKNPDPGLELGEFAPRCDRETEGPRGPEMRAREINGLDHQCAAVPIRPIGSVLH